jgi:hypothetical protein
LLILHEAVTYYVFMLIILSGTEWATLASLETSCWYDEDQGILAPTVLVDFRSVNVAIVRLRFRFRVSV